MSKKSARNGQFFNDKGESIQQETESSKTAKFYNDSEDSSILRFKFDDPTTKRKKELS